MMKDSRFFVDPCDLHSMASPLGEIVTATMLAHHHQMQQQLGIHPVCEGAYFVTKPETIEALREHFEQMAEYCGMKVMVPKAAAKR